LFTSGLLFRLSVFEFRQKEDAQQQQQQQQQRSFLLFHNHQRRVVLIDCSCNEFAFPYSFFLFTLYLLYSVHSNKIMHRHESPPQEEVLRRAQDPYTTITVPQMRAVWNNGKDGIVNSVAIMDAQTGSLLVGKIHTTLCDWPTLPKQMQCVTREGTVTSKTIDQFLIDHSHPSHVVELNTIMNNEMYRLAPTWWKSIDRTMNLQPYVEPSGTKVLYFQVHGANVLIDQEHVVLAFYRSKLNNETITNIVDASQKVQPDEKDVVLLVVVDIIKYLWAHIRRVIAIGVVIAFLYGLPFPLVFEMCFLYLLAWMVYKFVTFF
jgi:hypothetical protein